MSMTEDVGEVISTKKFQYANDYRVISCSGVRIGSTPSGDVVIDIYANTGMSLEGHLTKLVKMEDGSYDTRVETPDDFISTRNIQASLIISENCISDILEYTFGWASNNPKHLPNEKVIRNLFRVGTETESDPT